MPSSSRHDSLRDFLVEHARIDEATAELYAKRLVDDGFDDIESLHAPQPRAREFSREQKGKNETN